MGVFAVLISFLIVAPAGRAQEGGGAPAAVAPTTGAATLDAPAIRAALQGAFEGQGLVGLAAAVVWRGEITEFYFGSADREEEVAVDGKTLFRWASISKPVTAVAAMQLVEAGRLDLDRDVRGYVPEFPEKPWPVTARQLLQHRGGVVHYVNGKVVVTKAEYDAPHPFADVVLALDTFKESPLIAEPGTRYSYTTHGYILLGAVVQRAGGSPFHLQVKERVAAPLGMTTFRPDYQWEDIPGRATGYRRWGRSVVRSTDTDVSWKLPGGGYVSTVGDLARFGRGLLGEALVKEATREQMWTPQTAPEKESGRYPYGLGFGVRTVDGALRVSHSGAQEKTRTLLQLDPETGLVIALMTNSEWAKLAPVATAARAACP